MHSWIIENLCLVQIMLVSKTEVSSKLSYIVCMYCMYVYVYDDVPMHVCTYVCMFNMPFWGEHCYLRMHTHIYTHAYTCKQNGRIDI